MEWLIDLVDEYPTKRTDTAKRRLARVFKNTPLEVMQTAVDNYLLEQRFFPKVSDLKPYVNAAQVAAAGTPQNWEQVNGAMADLDLDAAMNEWAAREKAARLAKYQTPRCWQLNPLYADQYYSHYFKGVTR